jgi:hypothetical protein
MQASTRCLMQAAPVIYSGFLLAGLTVGAVNLLAMGGDWPVADGSAYWITHGLIVTFPVALLCAWLLSKQCDRAK